MSNTERIVEILREHRFERWSVSEPGFFAWWGHCTGCGFEAKRRTMSGLEWELNMRDDEVRHVAQIIAYELDVELAYLRGYQEGVRNEIENRERTSHRQRAPFGTTAG